jgi:hypothetical protein
MNAPIDKAQALAMGDVAAFRRAIRSELKHNADRIPWQLKALKSWLVWRVDKINATTCKVNKVPIYARTGVNRHGNQGTPHDIANLATFDEAMAAMDADSSLGGVGFACLPGQGIVALDVDHCVTNRVVDELAARVSDFTYAEISPSGTGIRAFWFGEASNGKNQDTGFELYSEKQFLTVTGDQLQNTHWLTDFDGALPTLDDETRMELEALSRPKGATSNRAPVLSKTDRANAAAADDPLFQAVVDNGLYEREIVPGKHSICCPKEYEHSDNPRAPGDGDTVLFQAHFNGYSESSIICSHTHGNNQAEYRRLLGLAESVVDLDAYLITHYDIGDVMDVLPHVIERWIPCDEVTLLAAHGGAGKSYVALILAIHVALGLPFADLATRQSDVLFFSGEDGGRVLRHRLARICQALKIDPADLDGRLRILDASDIDPALYREQRTGGTIVTETALLARLAELVERLGAGFVIIDNASDAYDGDEIKRAQVRSFIRSLRSRLARPGRAVLLLAHVNKAAASSRLGSGEGGEDYSGSTAWHNSVRSRLSLKLLGKDAMTVEHLKANLGAKAAPVRLDWRDGVPMPAINGSNGSESVLAAFEEKRDADHKAAMLALIQDFDRRGERVTTAFTGPATVYKLLRSAPGFPKEITSDRLTQLLRSMEHDGLLFRREVKTLDRKWRVVYTSVPSAPKSAPMLPSLSPSGGVALESGCADANV